MPADAYGQRSEIAAKQGRVLASAGLGNGPGVDASPALYPAERRHRGHALLQTSESHTQAQARA